MSELIGQYYAWLSGLARLTTPPLGDLAEAINIPLVSALLFGLIGAAAPCQLSTGVATLAFLSRGLGDPRQVWGQAVAFVLGKVTVYLVVGGAIVVAGLQLEQYRGAAIPAAALARRALGPLLILVGLFMLGALRLNLSMGHRLTRWIEEGIGGRRGILPAYLLGVAFAFTFCPTLFWLFFGLTIPLAIASPGGVAFPAVFALGTALPVLGLASLLTSGIINLRRVVSRFRSVDVWAQRVVGALFLLIGLNEVVLYWLI